MSETNGALVAAKPKVPSLAAGSKAMGIIPTSFDDCYRLAQCAVAAKVVPSGHDQTDEAVCMTILYGLELGIPPMQALQGITKINGKFCIYGDMVPATLWSKGFKLEETIDGDGDARTATCTVIRPDGTKIPRTFSVADAKVAGLWGKAGPWKAYPNRMLKMRARGFAAKDGASDALHGLTLAEEAQDIPQDHYSAVAVKQRVAELPMPPEIPAISTEVPLELGMEPLPEGYMDALESAFAAVKNGDVDSLNEVWVQHEAVADQLHPSDVARGIKLYHDHQARITL